MGEKLKKRKDHQTRSDRGHKTARDAREAKVRNSKHAPIDRPEKPPEKLTPEAIKKAEALLQVGSSNKAAAAVLKIPFRSYNRWRQYGRIDNAVATLKAEITDGETTLAQAVKILSQEEGIHPDEAENRLRGKIRMKDPIYREFETAVEAAQAEAKAYYLSVLRTPADKETASGMAKGGDRMRGAAEALKMLWPDEYNPRRIGVEGEKAVVSPEALQTAEKLIKDLFAAKVPADDKEKDAQPRRPNIRVLP